MSDVVLSACHLIIKILSFVLDGKIYSFCLYPNKTFFSITPRVFGCTCFVQNLSPELDKSIKYVFIGYSKTQKGYWCYNPSTIKYLVPVDVTFFESVLYFPQQVHVTASEIVPPSMFVSLSASTFTVSSPLPPVKTLAPPASKPVRDFRYVYTHRPKVPISELIPANPSPVDGPPPRSSASPSDFDILIAIRKSKRSSTNHPISNFVSYDRLNPIFRQFTLSLSSESIPQVLYRGFIGICLEPDYK